MKKNRPTNIQLSDLLTYKFPLAAITSIAHRISGVAVFVMLPLLIMLLQYSLSSEQSYNDLQECLTGFWVTLFLWLTLSALFYHLVAGIKHLIMDMGFGETIAGAKLSAQIVIAVSVVISVLLAAALW